MIYVKFKLLKKFLKLVTIDMDLILLWTDGSILNANQDASDSDDVAIVLSPTFLVHFNTNIQYFTQV